MHFKQYTFNIYKLYGNKSIIFHMMQDQEENKKKRICNICRISSNSIKDLYQRPIDIKIDEIRKRLRLMCKQKRRLQFCQQNSLSLGKYEIYISQRKPIEKLKLNLKDQQIGQLPRIVQQKSSENLNNNCGAYIKKAKTEIEEQQKENLKKEGVKNKKNAKVNRLESTICATSSSALLKKSDYLFIRAEKTYSNNINFIKGDQDKSIEKDEKDKSTEKQNIEIQNIEIQNLGKNREFTNLKQQIIDNVLSQSLEYKMTNCSLIRNKLTLSCFEEQLSIKKPKSTDLSYEKRKMKSKSKEGRILERRIQEGRVQEGRIQEGRIQEGRVQERRIQEGRIQEGRIQEGRVQEGRIQEGRVSEKKKQNEILSLKKQRQQKKLTISSPNILTTTHKDFTTFINLCNSINCENSGPFKVFIGKGNNQQLIKRLLKKRGWIETNSIIDANFVWTQKKEIQYIEILSQFEYEQKPIQKKKIRISYIFEATPTNQGGFTSSCDKIMTEQQKQQLYNIDLLIKKKKLLKFEFPIQNIQTLVINENTKVRMHNHFRYHHEIAYKKQLFRNLKIFYEKKGKNPFVHIPLTFHVQNAQDLEWKKFKEAYESRGTKNIWIIKPGENTNRGQGIVVKQSLREIKEIIQDQDEDKKQGTFIIQQYLMPMLYNKRKFDIRCYMLVTVVNHKLKAYWYEQGYIRTSCKIFNIKNIKNKFIHLTNDAIQKNSEDYGKYEPGNKLSFADLNKYFQKNHPQSSFYSGIYPQMVNLCRDSIAATFRKIHDNTKNFSFEIFGLDFMIDQNLGVWLIEINRNPCLQTGTFLLSRLITEMLDNAFRIAVDPIFPVGEQFGKNGRFGDSQMFEQNNFKLIFQNELTQEKKVENDGNC